MLHHQFHSSVSATKDNALRPPQGFRFGNFQGIQTLPSVGVGHVAGQHIKSYFNNKQIFYTICEWFESWMPWQKRIVLCGTTDRCSDQLLESLTTVLEPVFHRDFATALRGHYPRAPLKKLKSEEASHKEMMKALVMATEGTYLDPDNNSKRRSKKFQEIKDIQGFALHYAKHVIEGAIKKISAENETKLSLSDELDENNNLCSPVERYFRAKFSEQNFLRFVDLDSYGNTPDSQDSAYEEGNNTDGNGYHDLRTSPESNRQNISKHSSTSSFDPVFSKKISPPKLDSKMNLNGKSRTRSPRYNSGDESMSNQFKSRTLTEQQVGGFDATPTQSKLPPLEAKNASTLSWCMKRQLSASLPSTPASANSDQQSHHHQSNASSVDIGSTSEFFQKQRVSRLGSMHGALRTGRIKKPKQVQDLYIPLQKSYKNAKWWNGNKTARNKTTTKPAKENLKEHFKEQVKQIWQWLSEWEDHEKGDLLTELIKLCDQNLIQFFAQCLVQRLEDRSGINSLPDKLLFYIFTFLSTDDIGIAEKVCRRWYYIAAQEELWHIKCEELGRKENIPNLVEMVEEFMNEKAVDWREAYGELTRIVLNARFVDKGRRHGWLSGPSRMCHLLNLNFDDLLKRTPLPIESIQHIPIDSDSSSEENLDFYYRKMSTVVDLPIHFMQAVNDNDNDDDSQLSSRNTDADGVTPDVQGYRRNSQQTSRNEGTKSELANQDQDRTQSRQQKPPKVKKKLQKKKHASEDFALDIRPDPVQAKDVLEESMKKAEHDDLEEPPSQRQVVVNPVKRVRRLQGHLDAVFCLMFDSRRIVTGSMDRTIRVWDIRSGRSIRKIYGHKGGIRCIQFDEDKIISGSWDTTIMVWDIIHFDCLAVLSGHSDVVSCLQFNKKYLVTGSYDKTIRVWSLSGGYQCVRIIECHSEEVTCLMLDGIHVTSGSADNSIKVSNIETGECIMHITGMAEPVTSLALQGELILSGTLAGKLYFWNRATGEVEAGVQPHDTPIFNITFMPASHGGAKFLTAAGDGTIKEWDLYSMTCVRALHGHRGPVRDVQATVDRVVSCSDDGNVRIWDLYTPTVKAGTKAAEDTIDTTTIKAKKD